jgi:hypothetical protein
MPTLRSTGVAAGTAKRFQVLRRPADVGEHHPRHDDGLIEAFEPGSHQPDDHWRGDDADDAGDDER